MNTSSRPQEWLEAQLAELHRIFAEMGPDFSGLMLRTGELCNRFKEEHFRLAVLGQFKRGKSSLLNALMGEALLPTGVLPLTAIPTTLRYGPEPRVRVTWLDGRCEDYNGPPEALAKTLMRYVTERENPGNHLGISHVEVTHPNPLLAKGLEVIDTPGFGSTILQNTRTAKEVLPVCDGALFVISPDPPITEVEVQFLKSVKDAAARVIFVVSKADLLAPSQRLELVAFVREVLSRDLHVSIHERLFLISSHQALAARLAGDATLWAESGLGELETHLMEFLENDKRAALQDAIQRKGARLIREALFSVEIRRKAVELPRQELERRADRFESQLAKLDQEHVYFRDRLDGDRKRLLEEVDRHTDALTIHAREALTNAARKIREKTAILSETTDQVFGRAGQDLSITVATRFRSVQDTHCHEMEILIERVRRTAADLFEVPCLEGVVLDRLETIREPRVIHHRWVTSFTEEAASWLIRLLPSVLKTKRLERRLREDIDYLVNRNVEELRWTMRQNLEEVFRTFQTRMESQLEATIHSIRISVRAALEQQTDRESRLVPELHRLGSCQQRLVQLLAALGPCDGSASHGGPV